ncbi:hypothetical protein CSKR_110357, partial [Clonorchis sinensis]
MTRTPLTSTWHEFICICAIHGCTWAGILSWYPYLDRRTIRVLNQSLWLKSLTARQRCLAGNANALPFLRNRLPYVPTPNLEDQETVFIRPLAIDQPGMKDSVSVAGTPQVAEVRKPSHHAKRLTRTSRNNQVEQFASSFRIFQFLDPSDSASLPICTDTQFHLTLNDALGRDGSSGLGNLAVSQPSCFLQAAWEIGTGRVLQLNQLSDFFYLPCIIHTVGTSETF